MYTDFEPAENTVCHLVEKQIWGSFKLCAEKIH